MSKLTPTTIILIIAGIGIAVFAYFYVAKSKKKKNKKVTKTSTETNLADAQPELTDTSEIQPMTANIQGRPARLVRTPVGFALN